LLAELYEEGECIPQDIDEAAQLYSKAAEKGHEDAKHALQRLHLDNDASL